MENTVSILGAGYSYVAGLPLARDLLTTEYLYVPRRKVAQDWDRLDESFSRWLARNPKQGAEQYLQYLRSEQFGYEAGLWSAAVRRVAAALATPMPQDMRATSPRYLGNITRSYDCPPHRGFWDVLLERTDLHGVITTNYDLLPERSLRHRRITRGSSRPGCYYGGFPLPQGLARPEDPYRWKEKDNPLALECGIPVSKLHGSLNWSIEDGRLAMYADNRPAFRLKNTCAIVPPVPEKQAPDWLQPIWDAAEACLHVAQSWVVCGYSLPDYDLSIKTLLRRAGAGNCTTVYILDPFSDRLAERWQDVAPNAQVTPLSGLPEGTDELLTYL